MSRIPLGLTPYILFTNPRASKRLPLHNFWCAQCLAILKEEGSFEVSETSIATKHALIESPCSLHYARSTPASQPKHTLRSSKNFLVHRLEDSIQQSITYFRIYPITYPITPRETTKKETGLHQESFGCHTALNHGVVFVRGQYHSLPIICYPQGTRRLSNFRCVPSKLPSLPMARPLWCSGPLAAHHTITPHHTISLASHTPRSPVVLGPDITCDTPSTPAPLPSPLIPWPTLASLNKSSGLPFMLL